MGKVIAYPSWRPPPGFFKNISTNTPYDVRQLDGASSDIAGPYSNWSGGIATPDLSELGGIAVHGSGHLVGAEVPYWSGVILFNASTLAFTTTNMPPVPLSDSIGFDINGEGPPGSPAEGWTSVPHTYDGLIHRGAAHGGGPLGSMMRLSFAGAGGINSAGHEFRLDQPFGKPIRRVDNFGGTSYPAACLSADGSHFWYFSGNGNGPMRYYSFADFSYISLPNVGFNEYGNYNLALYQGDRPCLVSIGNSGNGGVNLGMYVAPIVNGQPTAFTKVTFDGVPPTDYRCGLQWSEILQCMISYESSGSYRIHRLTAPTSGPVETGVWHWTSELVVGLDGATPSMSTAAANGAWGRFIEAPKCGCFFWCDSITQRMQAFTLQGM